jgi:succinate dehydrogenase / fumarate reductase membrane anchor subunit
MDMVTSITTPGRSGLHDWLIQRISAIILAAYIVYLSVFIFSKGTLPFEVWSALFEQTWFKIFSLLSFLALNFHIWIGLWIISTDYLKPFVLRLSFQIISVFICTALSIWGAHILWSL